MKRYLSKRFQTFFLPILFIGMCLVLSGCGEINNTMNKVGAFWSTSLQHCWACAVYGSVFQVLSKIVSNGLPVAYSYANFLLIIGLLFFLVSKAGALALNPDNYKKIMQQSAYTMLKAIAVSVVLITPSYFYEVFISFILQPLGDAFLGLADIVLTSGPATNTSIELQAFDSSQLIAENTVWTISGTIDSSQIFGNLATQVQLLVFRIYRALRMGVAMGIYIFNSCGRYDFLGMIGALFMIIYAFELTMIIPCVFIDAFLRLGVVALTVPLLLVSWVFEGTSKLLPQLKSVVPIVLSSFLDIVFACMFIVVMATTLQTYSDAALNQAWTKGGSGTNVAFVTQAKFFSLDFMILIVLVVAFRRLAEHIGDISGIYGGGVDTVGWSLFGKVKDTMKGLGKSALGLVSANLGLVTAGIKQAGSAIIRRGS